MQRAGPCDPEHIADERDHERRFAQGLADQARQGRERAARQLELLLWPEGDERDTADTKG